jgi:hypothetical protein
MAMKIGEIDNASTITQYNLNNELRITRMKISATATVSTELSFTQGLHPI